MSNLAEKLRQKRRITIEIDGRKFFATRATEEQFLRYGNTGTTDAQVCRNHVTGWEGVTHNDLLEDGDESIAKWDKDVFNECIGDHSEWFGVITREIISQSMERTTERLENEKKLISMSSTNSSKQSSKHHHQK